MVSNQAITSTGHKEAQLEALFELSPDAIMLLDEKGFTRCNAAKLKMFGCSKPADFIGKHAPQFSPLVQPDRNESMLFAKEMIAKALKNGSNRFEWQHSRLDGTMFPAEVSLIAFEKNGSRVLQATVRDLSEIKSQGPSF